MHFAVFQPWGLGDLTMTTPVLAEFRRLHPGSKLTLIVGGPQQAALMKGSPLVDKILVLPNEATGVAQFMGFLKLRMKRIDVVFIGTRVARNIPSYLRHVSGIPVIIGDSLDGARDPYTVCNTIDPSQHRVERMLDTLALWTGQRPDPPHFSIGCVGQASGEVRTLLAEKSLQPGRFVVIHPGSAGGRIQRDKRIPAEVALRVAKTVVDNRADLSVAFILGPQDVGLIAELTQAGPRRVILSGCSLPTTVGILAQAAGFIGSDSGLGHIAAALGIPTVTLIGPTIPSETAPYGPRATTVQRRERLACQPCWYTPLRGQCPYGVRCMHELAEEDITTTVMTWGRPESG